MGHSEAPPAQVPSNLGAVLFTMESLENAGALMPPSNGINSRSMNPQAKPALLHSPVWIILLSVRLVIWTGMSILGDCAIGSTRPEISESRTSSGIEPVKLSAPYVYCETRRNVPAGSHASNTQHLS